MDKKYTLDEIIFEAMEKFKIEDVFDDKRTGKAPERFRKKFENYVNKTKDSSGKSLWDSAVDKEYVDADKKSFHFFSKEQKDNIIFSDDIYDYLIKRSSSENIKSQCTREQLKKMTKGINDEWKETLKKAGFPEEYSYTGIVPSASEIATEQNTIMSTALFELFFEPLNTELLSNDIFNTSYYGGDTETTASMDSRLRHSDLHNYYTPRKEISKELNIILDALADKIADRLKNNTLRKY